VKLLKQWKNQVVLQRELTENRMRQLKISVKARNGYQLLQIIASGPAYAYLIDMLIIVGAVLIAWWWWFSSVYLPSSRGEISESNMLMILLCFLLLYSFLWMFGYPAILEKTFSTTLGKWLFNIYVYDESGVRLTWSQAIRRNFIKTLPILLISELENNPKFQHGRDLQLKTVVVIRKRTSNT
jgi:uncharacterized RDD family membrane protein YckC